MIFTSPKRFPMPVAVAAAVCLIATTAASASEPTAEEASRFVREAEQELLDRWIRHERAAWVQSNFITHDTEILAAQALERLLEATARLAGESTRFDGPELPADVARKIRLIRTSLPVAAPSDPARQAELTEIAVAMEGIYGKGEYCPDGEECKDLGELSRILANDRDAGELLEAWTGWRTVSPPMREMYRRFVEIANDGAAELGFDDLGAMWRSGYDMPPDRFAAELDRLWRQVRPLYRALHCHVRARLVDTYGPDVVEPTGPIPAHLLGNMWSQSWSNIYDLVAPPDSDPGFDLTERIAANEVSPREMVRYGERFFTSLGFSPLPETFWERSLFTKPADREVVCHASAWDIDYEDDLRIKMCIEIDDEDFSTIHHELGHNFYQRAYSHQAPLYRDSANDGFHEGIGDTVALSVTPDYLVEIGLLEEAPPEGSDLGVLMRMALDKVAFLPFGLLMDQWRWRVFSGDIAPGDYNSTWWKLRGEYQGIAPPVERDEDDFDPGAKYHIPANVPYTRYFLAHILQFQFHRALCEIAGFEGPLHRCSIYGNEEAGRRLRTMLEMGRSRPWPDALEVVTGTREMDAGPILDYFAPLKDWLDRQNADRTCGW